MDGAPAGLGRPVQCGPRVVVDHQGPELAQGQRRVRRPDGDERLRLERRDDDAVAPAGVGRSLRP